MTFWPLTLISIGVSADAFAVALGKGLHLRRFNLVNAAIIAVTFGLFQALMPLIGYFLGTPLRRLHRRRRPLDRLRPAQRRRGKDAVGGIFQPRGHREGRRLDQLPGTAGAGRSRPASTPWPSASPSHSSRTCRSCPPSP